MSKLNTGTGSRSGTGPLQTETTASGKTHNAAPGYKRSPETELFMHATTRFYGESSYYEDSAVADERLRNLSRSLAIEPDKFAWMCGFAPDLRSEQNIRTASLVVAAEAVSARVDERRKLGYLKVESADAARKVAIRALMEGPLTNRQLLNAVQLRADEPAELTAWVLGRYGRRIPLAFKRGIADGATRLWDERAVLRYDKKNRPIRFADVLELCHPKPRTYKKTVTDWVTDEERDIVRTAVWQGILFRHLITERRGREKGLDGKPYIPPEELKGIRARWELNKLPVEDRHWLMRRVLDGDAETKQTVRLAAAGQWEWIRSWLGGKNDE